MGMSGRCRTTIVDGDSRVTEPGAAPHQFAALACGVSRELLPVAISRLAQKLSTSPVSTRCWVNVRLS